jgi:carbon-monoxide dehydrogenase medium subunit
MEIAVAGAAAVITLAQSEIQQARVAITALAPAIHRVPMAEECLIGAVAGPAGWPGSGKAIIAEAARLAAQAARPISDVRASAAYRRAMAAVVVRRAITTAILRATGTHVPVPASDTTFGGS